MEEQKKKSKGCGFLIIAVVILVLGIGSGGALMYFSAMSIKDSMLNAPKFNIPVTNKVMDFDSGPCMVFYHYPDTGNGSSTVPSDLKVIVKEKGTENEVTVVPMSSTRTKETNSIMISQFQIAKAGKYEVTCQSSTPGVLSIGHVSIMTALGGSCGGLGIIAFAGILALVFGIIGIIKMAKKS